MEKPTKPKENKSYWGYILFSTIALICILNSGNIYQWFFSDNNLIIKNSSQFSLQEIEKFEGVYISDTYYGNKPSGIIIAHTLENDIENIYAKQFSTEPNIEVNKIIPLKVSGDTLFYKYKNHMDALVVSSDSPSGAIYSCDANNSNSITIIDDLDRIIVNKYTDMEASKAISSINEDLAKDLLKPSLKYTRNSISNTVNPHRNKHNIKENLPRFVDVRSRLIHSSNFSTIKRLLGKPDDEWNQGALDYKVYYYAATENGRPIHIRLIWSHRDSKVTSLESYTPGSLMQIGAFHQLITPN